MEYRGKHLHHPIFNQNGQSSVNGTILPGPGLPSLPAAPVMPLNSPINGWHAIEANKNGFGQAQSRKYVGGIVANIDKKLAEREVAIRQEPASDAELAQLQEMEGKVLADFRDVSLAEFERFHIGASRVMWRENTFYALDIGKSAYGYLQPMVGDELCDAATTNARHRLLRHHQRASSARMIA